MNNPIKKENVNNLLNNVTSFLGKRYTIEKKAEDLGLVEHRTKSGPGILLGALAGLAVGAGAALLLARQSGSELRGKLGEQLDVAKNKFNDKKEETLKFAKRETENVANAAKANRKDFTQQGK